MRTVFNFFDVMPERITYTAQETAWIATLINSNLSHDSIWSGKVNSVGVRRTDRDTITDKIKRELSRIQNGYCYYCGLKFEFRVGLVGIRNIEREHFAPKSTYKQFTFTPENLVLACSICNGTDYKGSENTIENLATIYRNCTFNIIQPYLDNRSDHLSALEDGTIMIVNGSIKGWNTIKLFGLNETYPIEIRSLHFKCQRYRVDSVDDLEGAIQEAAIQEFIRNNRAIG